MLILIGVIVVLLIVGGVKVGMDEANANSAMIEMNKRQRQEAKAKARKK